VATLLDKAGAAARVDRSYSAPVPVAAIVSFRLGGTDGVSIEAAKWAAALGQLGWDLITVAGSGPVDTCLPGLAIAADVPPMQHELSTALERADLVVIENLCSLPLNPAAADVVASVCAGRPTVLHHHDLPWQRSHLAHLPPPPDDPQWAHVTINELSRRQLEAHGIAATTIYNSFDPQPPLGHRDEARASLGVTEETRLLLQPTRALARKNVSGGLALAAAAKGTYWLMGPAEDGYGPELDRLVAGATGPVILGAGHPPLSIADAYAACDAVLLPSTWEGFGNPALESATHRRPLAIGSYPVAEELAKFGFQWFDATQPDALAQWLDAPDQHLLEHNREVAARHFNQRDLPERISRVLERIPLP
jgi:glycosyltransferase involved in cell wall biosynthesis